jgi:hypothetical protein
VTHQGHRIERLEKSIDEAIASAPPRMKAVIAALQSPRGAARSSNISMVNRRLAHLDHCPFLLIATEGF